MIKFCSNHSVTLVSTLETTSNNYGIHSSLSIQISLHLTTHTHTCSFVVRPRATKTIWNPVNPATGTKKRPATHMTAILNQTVKKHTEIQTSITEVGRTLFSKSHRKTNSELKMKLMTTCMTGWVS